MCHFVVSGLRQNGFCGFNGSPANAWGPRDLKKLLEMHAEHGNTYRWITSKLQDTSYKLKFTRARAVDKHTHTHSHTMLERRRRARLLVHVGEGSVLVTRS